jgi:hypothetical protein
VNVADLEQATIRVRHEEWARVVALPNGDSMTFCEAL